MNTTLLPGLAACGKDVLRPFRSALVLAIAALALPVISAQTPTVIPNHDAYYPGEAISVSFANGPGNPLDWIGIYPDGVVPDGDPGSTDWVYVGGTRQAGAGLTDGTVTFTAGLNLAGDWKVYLLLNDGYTIAAEAAFKVVDPSTPLVRVGKRSYGVGEPITITFANGYGNPKDWIGVYLAGQVPGGGPDSTLWSYVDGTQDGTTGLAEGTITFATGLAKAGSYVAYFLLDDGYDILASEAFEVIAAAVPPKVVSVSPADNATDGVPVPRYSATISNGSIQVVPGTIVLKFDGTTVTPQVTPQADQVLVSYQSDTVLAPNSVHSFLLTFDDNASPAQHFSSEVHYTVAPYESLQLPAPLYLQDFEGLGFEGELPAGWTENNYTDITNGDLDWTNLDSLTYAGWTTVNLDRFNGSFITYSNPDNPDAWETDYHRVLTPNLRYVVNGKLVDPMATGRMLFANSGYRNGRSQVQFLYTPDFDLTGKTDIYVSFHSLWEQNQDSLAALEFSTDGGSSWLPIAYLLEVADVIRDAENNIDVDATFNTARAEIAMYFDPDEGTDKGGTYGAFIAAPISSALAPFIQGRAEQNPRDSKRVELYRLPQADNQAKVRFRFAHAGSDSWYWGIDDFGLYSIPQVSPPTITGHPQTQTAFAGDAVTLTVSASGVGPLVYAWLHNGNPVEGANAASLVIPRAQAANVGEYKARVTNSAGSADSQPATLSVVPLPSVVAGTWNFGNEHLGITSGVGELTFADGDVTAGLTAFESGPPPIGGDNAAFMRVPAFGEHANGYDLAMPTQPVGAEGSVNRYSMAWDILLPGDVNWTPLLNTSPGNANDADFYVSDTGAIGIGALGYSAAGLVLPDVWYRVVFTANLGSGRVSMYVNGALVHERTGGSLAEGRFALYSGNDAGPDVRLFNEGDSSGVYTHEILVNSFAFISRELTPAEVAAMGGPSVAGIMLPQPSTPIEFTGAPTVAAGQITLQWTGGTGPFQVQKAASLPAATWDNVGNPTTQRTVTDTVTGNAGYYRVLEP